eukprot:365990-Chlamydomonas_euryale.AAC.23
MPGATPVRPTEPAMPAGGADGITSARSSSVRTCSGCSHSGSAAPRTADMASASALFEPSRSSKSFRALLLSTCANTAVKSQLGTGAVPAAYSTTYDF